MLLQLFCMHLLCSQSDLRHPNKVLFTLHPLSLIPYPLSLIPSLLPLNIITTDDELSRKHHALIPMIYVDYS